MDEAYLRSLIAGFEDGSWPVADFHHMQHLAVAVHYLAEDPEPMDTLRARIMRYNVSQGGENTEDRGYHETITRFWLEVVHAYMAGLPEGLSRVEVTRRVVEEFAPKRDLFREYYDFDVLKSREARARWIPPNQSPGVTSILPTPSA
jgi:hypothetical protein